MTDAVEETKPNYLESVCGTVTGLAAQWAVFDKIPIEIYCDEHYKVRYSLFDRIVETRSKSFSDVICKLQLAIVMLSPEHEADAAAAGMLQSALDDLDAGGIND